MIKPVRVFAPSSHFTCKSNSKVYTCCICGHKFHDYGNNPQPISQNIGDRCCNECNQTHVIPARLTRHLMGLPARG